MSELVVSQV